MERPSRSKKPKTEPSLAARALRLLARREHTRRELERKLAPYTEDTAALQAVLDDMAARGWLSEARVVEQVVHAKRARLGPARIRHALLERGVPEELIGPALGKLKETEVDAARAVRARKFRLHAQTQADEAKQVRFLQSRGFGIDIAIRVVRESQQTEET